MLLQLKTQQFTLQFLRLRGEKQTPGIFILCFYTTLRQLNNTRDSTSPSARDAMLHFLWRHAYVLYFMFDPNRLRGNNCLENGHSSGFTTLAF